MPERGVKGEGYVAWGSVMIKHMHMHVHQCSSHVMIYGDDEGASVPPPSVQSSHLI